MQVDASWYEGLDPPHDLSEQLGHPLDVFLVERGLSTELIERVVEGALHLRAYLLFQRVRWRRIVGAPRVHRFHIWPCRHKKNDGRTRAFGGDLTFFFFERMGERGPWPNQLSLFYPKSDAGVRPYQRACTERCERRNGFVVAPCASGKTLMGLLIAARNGGRALVLTPRYAEQWSRVLHQFFDSFDGVVAQYKSNRRASDTTPDFVISTYAAFLAKPRTAGARELRAMRYRTLILDEAHNAASPAQLRMIKQISVQYVVGLTATKVREDRELDKLEAYIGGGTIHTIDRANLVKHRYVEDVRCIDMLVPYDARLEIVVPRAVALTIHPNKVRALCGSLIRLSRRGHKVLVFCDDIFCLHWVHDTVRHLTNVPVVGAISMKTVESKRTQIMTRFECAHGASCLFLSRTGDEALNLPKASAGIVMHNYWGSRRQVVQRIGRIVRIGGDCVPVFLVLISNHARELKATMRRRAYLDEHGFVATQTTYDPAGDDQAPAIDVAMYVRAVERVRSRTGVAAAASDVASTGKRKVAT